MRINCHDAFIAMYYSLDAAYDDARFAKEGVLSFLTDADPFIWKDRMSADPVVYSEFRSTFEGVFGSGTAEAEPVRSFCGKWLDDQIARHEVYAGSLREAFDSVATTQKWKDVLEYIQSQDDTGSASFGE